MSQANANSLGVVEPSPVIARRKVNENLLKIKQEIQDAQDVSDISDLESDYDYTQPIRPQQFFAYLDTKLDALDRKTYTRDLLKLCKNDYSQLSDYRERLVERAQGFSSCPQGRLVKRKNSILLPAHENKNVLQTATFYKHL